MQRLPEALTTRGWLAATPADFRAALLGAGQEQHVPAGVLFNRAGDPGDMLWGVVQGQVAASSAMNGADTGPGILFNPGDWGGYPPLFGGQKIANCRAITDVRLFQVPFARLRALLADRPDWWEHLGRLALTGGLSFAVVGADLIIRDSRRRLAAILLNQAGCRLGGQGFPVHLTLSELGEMANLSRHPVAGILQDLEQKGWIIRGYRMIRLIDPDALRRLADGD